MKNTIILSKNRKIIVSTMSKYQGYPYVNPIVNDVPSIDPATASKWAHLPRKPLQVSIPEPGGSGSGISRDAPSTSVSRPGNLPKKPEDDENPVVYIDVPDPDESVISTSIETPNIEPEYVQDTILYNPFDNKRIDVSRDDTGSSSSEYSYNGRSSPSGYQTNQGGSSRGPYGIQSPTQRPPQTLPTFMEKESFIYGGHSSDGFPLSPIPVSDFPEPPPSYTEAAASPTPTPAPVSHPPAPEPPRTQVIVPEPDPQSPVGVMSYNRKYVACQHCGNNVHTLVIRENGWATFLIAFLLFFVILPFFIIVYFCDCFKHKNHYCPSCHKMIGYELPFLETHIQYKNP